jgi:DNA-binding MarR family transcriptional regulator
VDEGELFAGSEADLRSKGGPMMAADPEKIARVDHVCGSFRDLFRNLHAIEKPPWIDVDLTMSQLKAIVLVVETGGLSGRVLGEKLGITPSAVTALVDRLVQRGYVRREEDLADRRISWARPTTHAQDLFERLHASHRQQIEETLALLTSDELAIVDRAMTLLKDASAQRLAAQSARPIPST